MIKHALLLLLIPALCILISCSRSKNQRIKYQVYKNDRLMYVAYHMVSEEMSALELWKELHKKIYFTPIDGKPEVAPSNHLFNLNPFVKSKGNITILILDGDEILSHTTVEQVVFKPAYNQQFWELAFGQADKIVKTITPGSEIVKILNDEEPSDIDVDNASETTE